MRLKERFFRDFKGMVVIRDDLKEEVRAETFSFWGLIRSKKFVRKVKRDNLRYTFPHAVPGLKSTIKKSGYGFFFTRVIKEKPKF